MNNRAHILLAAGIASATVFVSRADVFVHVDSLGETSLEGGWSAFEAAQPYGEMKQILTVGVEPLDDFSDIATPNGTFLLDPVHNLRTFPGTFGSWSHGGPIGEQIFRGFAPTTVYLLPPGTAAFDFYLEPSPFSLHEMVISAVGSQPSGAHATLKIEGMGGAAHIGFIATNGETISRIDIDGNVDRGIAEVRFASITSSVADLNVDGLVNPADLAILLSAWGPPVFGSIHPDFDMDGTVGPGDLAVLLSEWGEHPIGK